MRSPTPTTCGGGSTTWGCTARPDAGGWLVSGCDEHVDIPAERADSTLPANPGRARPRARETRAVDARRSPRRSSPREPRDCARSPPTAGPMLGADAEADGLWWLAGLGGAGVSGGFAAAEAVAAWMDGRDSTVLRHPALVGTRAASPAPVGAPPRRRRRDLGARLGLISA